MYIYVCPVEKSVYDEQCLETNHITGLPCIFEQGSGEEPVRHKISWYLSIVGDKQSEKERRAVVYNTTEASVVFAL